jgi:hypothetical protein
MRRCRAAVGSPSSVVTEPRRRRGFGTEALKLFFIFSEYIQFLVNSKICVGFI